MISSELAKKIVNPNKAKSAEEDQEQPFLSHLLELRQRLMHTIIGILVVFVVLVLFANPLCQAQRQKA